MSVAIIVLGLFIFSIVICCGSVEYYVTPTPLPNTNCPPGKPCHTLEHYALNTSLLSGQDNVSLLFLEGEHVLKCEFRISDVKVLLLAGFTKRANPFNSTHIIFRGIPNECGHVFVSDPLGLKNMYRERNFNVSYLSIRNLHIQELVYNDEVTLSFALEAYSILVEQFVVEGLDLSFNGQTIICNQTTLNPETFSIQSESRIQSASHQLQLVDTNYNHIAFIVNIAENSTVWLNITRCTYEQISTNIFGSKEHILLVYIKDSTIIGSGKERGTFLYLSLFSNHIVNVTIINTTFWKNGVLETGLFPSYSSLSQSGLFVSILIRNVTIMNTNRAIRIEHIKNLVLEDCRFINNRGTAVKYNFKNIKLSGRMVFIHNTFNIVIIDTIFSNGNAVLNLEKLSQFKSMQSTRNIQCYVHILIRNVTIESTPTQDIPTIQLKYVDRLVIQDSQFVNNSNNAIDMYFSDTTAMPVSPCVANSSMDIIIENTMFRKGKEALNTRVLVVYNFATKTSSLYVTILLKNVTVETMVRAITVQNMFEVTIENCKFVNNSETAAIEAYSSDITLSGDNLFANNTGRRGGAIALYQSHLILDEGANIFFTGNQAKKMGGAIYVQLLQEVLSLGGALCFFLTRAKKINLWFQDNSAVEGGDDVYGGIVNGHCIQNITNVNAHSLNTFHFINESLSSISSDPTRVCLCDDQGTPQCADIAYIYRELSPRFPGESFTVTAVVVGYGFGTVPGVVHSEISSNEIELNLQDQYIQRYENIRECVKLNITILSPLETGIAKIQMDVDHVQNKNIELVLSVQEELMKRSLNVSISKFNKDKVIFHALQYYPVFVTVPLEDCPVGFNLTNTPPYICTCHPTLEENGISVCVITNHTGRVYRSGTVWVSASFTENETNSFVVHRYCPYDYCKQENISIDLRLPENQCALNRSGTLCGSCYGNLSLALGSARCLPCDSDKLNRFVSLFLVFIFFGFALVFFIKILDITVAKGTANGLIFYANIVWANKSILFPNAEKLHPVQQILQTFIAWLNLDLGIETCFIDGLDAYWKTWLQFVFPIYVWTITGVVIIASRYSTGASKVFGNNSVPVLATLILLSYAKLLRTIITSLGFSLLNYEQGTRIVWSSDGNVPYFGSAHTILFLVAIAALLLLWLPYTTVLLTLQWLRRKSYLKPLRWINRWKPFFDAYFGQLKPKNYYWVGLLLLVRVLLLTLFAVTSAVVPMLNIVAIAFLGVFLLIHFAVFGMVYRLLSLSILEGSFILNLTLLAILKPYVHSNPIANSAVIYTSVGIVFVEFVVIVIYHAYSKIKSTYVTYRRRRHTVNNTCADRELRVIPAVHHNQIHYREPLLDSSVQDN